MPSVLKFPARVPVPASQPPTGGDAVQEILERVRAMDPASKLQPREFGEAFREFYRTHCATLRSPESVEYKFRVLRPYFAGRVLHEIAAPDIEDMIADRLGAGSSQPTCNRLRAHLSKLFNWAISRGYAIENPVRRVKKFREDRGRTRYLTADEFDRLVKAADSTRTGHLAPIVFTAVHTGGRLMEILSLEWRDIDFTTGTVTFRGELCKSGKTRVVPMVPALAETLKDVRATQRLTAAEQERVFTFRGRPLKSLRTAFGVACRKAGLTGVRFHDLRHTFASWYMMNSGDLYRLQLLLGHQGPTMTQRYSHVSKKFIEEGRTFIGKPGSPNAPVPQVIIEKAPPPPPIRVPAETVRLLRDLRGVFKVRKRTYVTTREALDYLVIAKGWHELAGPVPHTSRRLAAMLRPVGVKACQVGQHTGANTKGFTLGRLAPAFARYLGN
jgi:integrase